MEMNTEAPSFSKRMIKCFIEIIRKAVFTGNLVSEKAAVSEKVLVATYISCVFFTRDTHEARTMSAVLV